MVISKKGQPTTRGVLMFFGYVSYGACSNYALIRTAKENEKKYGTETTRTLTKNFYVDDPLKSVNSESDAIKLIKNIRSMCNEGGFNWTKFISNSKDVLHSIPESFRKNGAKDKDLAARYLMNKRWVSCRM